MSMKAGLVVAAFTAMFSQACSDQSAPGATTFVYQDIGEICLCEGLPGRGCYGVQIYNAGARVSVEFWIPGLCLSSSCMQEQMGSCSVTANGTTLNATTYGSYVDVKDSIGHSGCTADCRGIGATCETDPVPAGSYTIIYGTHTLALTVPSQLDLPPCVLN